MNLKSWRRKLIFALGFGAFVLSAGIVVGSQGSPWSETVRTCRYVSNYECDLVAAGTATSTAVLAASLIAHNGSGLLYSLDVSADSTLSGAAWWVLVYDATSVPADGTVTPKKCFAEPSGATLIHVEFPNPVAFTNGIVVVASTTGCFSQTKSTHAFLSVDYQ